MLEEDEQAWECDMAETYGLIDIESIPLRKLATLSAGLPDSSRIKLKMSGMQVSLEVQLMALMIDKLSVLVWAKTKDAQDGKNYPKSIYEALSKVSEPKAEREYVLTTSEEFYKRWYEE